MTTPFRPASPVRAALDRWVLRGGLTLGVEIPWEVREQIADDAMWVAQETITAGLRLESMRQRAVVRTLDDQLERERVKRVADREAAEQRRRVEAYDRRHGRAA